MSEWPTLDGKPLPAGVLFIYRRGQYAERRNLMPAELTKALAAPDLYEALEDLLAEWGAVGWDDAVKRARAALSRARGETE